MNIVGHYEYWRSFCYTIKSSIGQDPRFLSVKEFSSRDISPNCVEMTEEHVDVYATIFANNYFVNYDDTEIIEMLIDLVISSTKFNDIDLARVKKKYGKDANNLDIARYAIYHISLTVLKSLYMSRDRKYVNIV